MLEPQCLEKWGKKVSRLWYSLFPASVCQWILNQWGSTAQKNQYVISPADIPWAFVCLHTGESSVHVMAVIWLKTTLLASAWSYVLKRVLLLNTLIITICNKGCSKLCKCLFRFCTWAEDGSGSGVTIVWRTWKPDRAFTREAVKTQLQITCAPTAGATVKNKMPDLYNMSSGSLERDKNQCDKWRQTALAMKISSLNFK